jgi:hypothetical protein
MEKHEKRARVKTWQAQQRAAARDQLPMAETDFESLFTMLEHHLAAVPCDHSRNWTSAWLTERSFDLAAVFAWLDETGGFCNCEVLHNSMGKWLWAIGRDG